MDIVGVITTHRGEITLANLNVTLYTRGGRPERD